MKSTRKIVDGDGAVINHLMATGEIVAAQLPVASSWSPEKRLAAAVLTSALISLRDHRHDAHHREEVEEDLAWLASDDGRSPYSFACLCDVFGLESSWVRGVVERWAVAPEADSPGRSRQRTFSMHRHAA